MAMQHDPLLLGDLQVSADTLGSVILGANVKLMMRDTTYIEGKVLRASREEIVMQVKKSEPKGKFQGGEATLKTSEIATVHMKKNGSVAAPVALGVVGGILGMFAGAAAGFAAESDGALLMGFIGGGAGGATLGAYTGHAVAMKIVTISVVPAGR